MTVGRRAQLLKPSGFGALLKRYRVTAGLTQEGLAELAGLSVRGISDLERGIALRPQRETLAALLAALRLSSQDRARLEAAARHRRAFDPGTSDVPRAARQTIPLVGRSRELAIIGQHLAGDTLAVLALAGEPGIGKSRLLQEGARLATAQGYTVLQGGAQRRSGQDPYAPMLDTLARSVAGLAPPRLRAALAGCGWLVRLLPELVEMVKAPMPAGALAAEQERRLVFAAVGRCLSNLAGPAGTLLVLDDLQWAGPDGLDLLASLLEPGPDLPICLLCAYRDTEVGADHPLAAVLAQLSERRLVEHVSLAPLSEGEALQVLDELLSGGEAVDVQLRQQIVERTGGVPFFLVSFAHWLVMDTEGAVQSLPWNVAQSIRQRMAALNDEARTVLQAAAVVGRVVPRSTLLAALGSPEQEVLTGLDAACRSRLLLPEGRSTYRFAHDVVRESIEEDLGEAQRILLHRRVGEVLETLPERERTARAAELAWHFLEGDAPRRALLYSLEAGDQAQRVFAHEEAERQYQMAVPLAQEAHDRTHEAEALEKLGTMYWTLGRYEEALSVLEQALSAYEALADLDAVGRVAGKVGWAHSHQGTGEEGIARLEPLATRLEQSGATGALVDAYGALVHLYLRHGRRDDLLAATERAADAAQAVIDDTVRVRGELNRGLALMWQGRFDAALEVLQRVIPRAEEVHDAETLFRALKWAASMYIDLGELKRARAYMEWAVEATKRATSPSFHTTALGTLSRILFCLGDWRGAREYGERAIDLEPAALSWAAGDAHLGLAQRALVEGRWEEVSAHLDEAEAIFERTRQDRRMVVQCLLAQKDLLDGKSALTLARLQPLEARLEGEGRQVLAEALVDMGDAVHAVAMVEEGVRETRALRQRMALVDWLRLQGMVLTRAARWEEARAALEEGLTLARDMPYPYEAGRILFEMGRMHAARQEESPAQASFEEALGIFEGLEARPYLERTEGALRGLG